MYTLMHISDLHRSAASPISNDELISCLLTDNQRFSLETPPISSPNALIISGDLVAGLPIKAGDYPSALERQFDEAHELIKRLADVFFEGDHTRIIITPGNHDIDWNSAFTAMTPVAHDHKDIEKLLYELNSPYRWSWENLQLFQINDYSLYEKRFGYFQSLIDKFYKGNKVTFAIDPKREWNLFNLDSGKIIVCAFNSCVNADCFSSIGDISGQAISQSHLACPDALLKIAVWHHDIQGSPHRSDYMDTGVVRLLIDRGYRLGLYGHRHSAGASPYSLHVTPEDSQMAIISAGSLCAAPHQLPPGLLRQYNIIQIFDDYVHARIHVREMNSGVFSQGRLIEQGGKSYMDLKWTAVPQNSLVNTGRSAFNLSSIEEIEGLLKRESYEEVVTIIDSYGSKLGRYGRQLLIKALYGTKNWIRLEQELPDPQNSDELSYVISAAIALKHWDKAETVVCSAKKSGQFSQMFLDELKNRIAAMKGIRG